MPDTTSIADPEARAAVTAGLRALAEFLDAHPVAGVFALLVLLLVGIRTEERHMSLTSGPRTCATSLARRLTGASVRRPQRTPHCRYEDTRS